MDARLIKILKHIIEFPNPQMCKHYAALTIINEFQNDFDSTQLIESLVDCDDVRSIDILNKME